MRWPGSCSPSVYVMIVLAVNAVKLKRGYIESSGWQNDCFEPQIECFESECSKSSGWCFPSFPSFLHVRPTYSMFSHPRWKDGTICRALVEDTRDLLVDEATFVLINFAKSILDVLLLCPWTLFDLVPYMSRTQTVSGLIFLYFKSDGV